MPGKLLNTFLTVGLTCTGIANDKKADAPKTYTSTYSSTRDFLVKAAGGIINEAE